MADAQPPRAKRKMVWISESVHAQAKQIAKDEDRSLERQINRLLVLGITAYRQGK